jgi:hypothetical protein
VRDGESEITLQVLALERKDSMALRYAYHTRVTGPARALRQRAVDYNPAIGASPVRVAHKDLERAPLLIECPAGVEKIAHRVWRIIFRQANQISLLECLSGGSQRRGPTQHEMTPPAQRGAQLTLAALAHGGGNACRHQWGRPGIAHDLGTLDTIQKGQGLGIGIGESYRNGVNSVPLDQASEPDAGLFGSPPCLGDERRRGQSLSSQRSAQGIQVHGNSMFMSGL